MRPANLFLSVLYSACLMLAATGANAEKSQDFGDYVVHFNALNTDLLSPKVATEYNIKRSGNRAMLNVVVLRKVLGATGQPVPASVTGIATTLSGQQRELALREIREPNAIYYIADFGVDHEETLRFHLKVRPEGESDTFQVEFRQQFFSR
ncbi:MAG: DUF4426 domain-containing protein [Thiohalobacteraceae bacterium]|nr:DUF4426 domain-containing protein [Gammaproteobacteria bacterium]